MLITAGWLLVAQGTWPLAGGQLNRADGTGDMAVSWGDDPEAAGENVSRWKRLAWKKNVIGPGTGLRSPLVVGIWRAPERGLRANIDSHSHESF